jgi:hypothetical protein
MTHDEKEFKKCSSRGCRTWILRRFHRNKCAKHEARDFKEKHPLAYALHKLRTHARARGIGFSLTFEQFKSFAEKTDYMKLKGSSTKSLHVDRIENGLGYHAWNIQAITLKENNRKNYVAYFNGGMIPDTHRHQEYLEFERQRRDELENISAQVQNRHAAGTPEFWQEFNKIKQRLYDLLEQHEN